MGNEETDAQAKTPKSSSAPEQPPTTSSAAVFPDWASFQAYYNSAGTPPIPPPGYTHPYMWGQHMLPPYGTPPPPYVAMYPHGGLYAHPSMPPGSHPYNPYAMLSPNGTAEASGAASGGRESEAKSGEGKSKNPLKRSKGSLGSLSMLTGKGGETGKAPGAYNGGFSQSGESGGSSEGSDADSQNGSQQSEKGSADAEAQNGGTHCSVTSGVTQAPSTQAVMNQNMVMTIPPNSVSGPTTNLNIGMDYWGATAPSQVATGRAKLPTVPAPSSMVPSSLVGSRDSVPSELWIQDERELKKQRRKQSNRESARRSRLRKQAEYDELALRVDALKEENNVLREQLERMREECEKLASENASLTEKLQNPLDPGSREDGVNGQPESDSQLAAKVDQTERN
ncbi:hypothetical protein Scep_016340 [Stephania cephalantha]|uniref:BZIP domain-containing protein n=1 Tax=Stephania cephalantha TaxID=152367 RepID=A0AAP0IPD5_9MAGN